MSINNLVPVLELRRLLYSMKESRPDIGVRFRLMGELWQPNFSSVLLFTENGVAVQEEHTNKVLFVPDLANVMQFEIENAFQQYEPYFHYSVDTTLVH